MTYPVQREALGPGFLVADAEDVDRSGPEAVSLGKRLAFSHLRCGRRRNSVIHSFRTSY